MRNKPLNPTELTLREMEEAMIRAALNATRWNIMQSAARLGMDRGTLYRKLRRMGLTRPASTIRRRKS